MNIPAIRALFRSVREKNRTVLLDTEGLDLLKAMGIPTPAHVFVHNSAEASSVALTGITGRKAVIKVVSPEILHKTDVGGVKIIQNDRAAIVTAIQEMEKSFKGQAIDGYTINQFVEYEHGMGREIIVGMRWTEDFGPVVTYGAGGIYAEFLSDNFKTGRAISILSPTLTPERKANDPLPNAAVSKILGGGYRNQPALVPTAEVNHILDAFLRLAAEMMPEEISEFEINPFVVADNKLVALDVLVKLRAATLPKETPACPIAKLQNLLEPKSVAIIGVSEKGMNPGRIILGNLIQEKFDTKRIYIIKQGVNEIDGCRCVPDLASLPEKVDLLILSVSAAQVPEIVLQMVREQRAESAIVIPGGLEEKQGGETLAHAMRETLTTSRTTTWQGPVINGGNCLGIRSLPGHYNTLFIPEYKLPVAKGKVAPLALVSQSGAFAISRISRITAINPKFAISVGNQMDLTIGDYLTYLKDDPELDIFAIYVEGFKRLDGLRFLKAATELRKKGKTVILYRAGRTAAGAQASASHTASMAGDYMVTRALCEQAGVILCETIDEFEDLTLAFTQLHGKKAKGWKLGAVSNAGCECVAIADNLGKFELAELSAQTHERLEKLFIKTGISQIVDVHNPLDLTPMAGDEAYEQSAHAILEDPGVHAAVIGVVPLSTALNSLAPASHHREDVSRPDSVGSRLAALKNKTEKPWVAVVDAGAIYDPLAKLLTEQGVPTFRSADRALRALNAFVKN